MSIEQNDIQTIMVVDDDPNVLRIVELSLRHGGFNILKAASGDSALALIRRHGVPHLVIVDLMMPGMGGFELCHQLHEFSDVPVIMLTAIDEEETIIEGIEQYAEDYITKPFSPGELAARVGRVLRRIGSFAYTLEPLTEVDSYLQIDFPGRRAIVAGKEVSLTPTETRLLYVLMRSAGRVVNTEFILRRVWPLEDARDVRLHVHIHRLRHKIEKNHKNPRYIVSERGVGYIFPVRQKTTSKPQPANST